MKTAAGDSPRATPFECTVSPHLSALRPCEFFPSCYHPLIETSAIFKVRLGK